MQPLITILDGRAAAQTASPSIVFRLRMALPGRVHATVLRCQVLIDARDRRYDAGDRERLYELFGDATQFDRAIRAIPWSQSSIAVPTFDDEAVCELPVACTYDLDVAAAKYLNAMRDGDVPLRFLFSGTLFRVVEGTLRVEPVSWDVEAAFRLSAGVWRAAMDQHFPGGGWIRLQRETLDRLQAFRGRSALVTWDHAIDALLDAAQPECAEVRPQAAAADKAAGAGGARV
jgi:hypothetical protein